MLNNDPDLCDVCAGFVGQSDPAQDLIKVGGHEVHPDLAQRVCWPPACLHATVPVGQLQGPPHCLVSRGSVVTQASGASKPLLIGSIVVPFRDYLIGS